jgi:hypothetical protein
LEDRESEHAPSRHLGVLAKVLLAREAVDLIGRIYGDAAREDGARVIEYDRASEANRTALGLVRAGRAIVL